MKTTKTVSILCALLALSLLFCGCSEDSAPETSGTRPLPPVGQTANAVRTDDPSEEAERSTAIPAIPSEPSVSSGSPDSSGPPVSSGSPETSGVVSTGPTESTEPSDVLPADPPLTVSSDADQTAFEKIRASAKYVLLFDETDDRLLYLKGSADERIYPASITKLLTVQYGLTLLENPDEVFTVGEEIGWIGPHSSVVELQRGERYTAKDLIACMLIRSGNDAAYAFATGCGFLLAGEREVSRREALDLFLDGMNEYAQNVLGLTGSHFESPDGFHSDGHYTTLRDLLKIARTAYANPTVREMTRLTEYSVVTADGSRTLELKSTNMMLYEDSPYYLPYVNGLKTGNTDMAGSCVAVSADRDGHVLILLLMKSNDPKGKFREAMDYIEAGYGMTEEQAPAQSSR